MTQDQLKQAETLSELILRAGAKGPTCSKSWPLRFIQDGFNLWLRLGRVMLETKNVKFVAFLRLKGIHPDEIKKIARGKASFLFKMTEETWMSLKQEFDRSDFIKYGQCIDAIVDLAY